MLKITYLMLNFPIFQVTELVDLAAEVQYAGLDSAIRDVVGKNKMDYILKEGKVEISGKTEELMQGILDSYQSGIELTTVNLQDSQPPDPVQAAFDDATKAREDMEKFKNEAEAYANEVLPVARGEAARMIQDNLHIKKKL